jgi:hypothetical protein
MKMLTFEEEPINLPASWQPPMRASSTLET